MVVSVLATVMLRIMSNQARLTHHQVSRIQSIYAAKAGIVYALDKLRRNDDNACWPNTGTYTRRMQRSGSGCDVIETDLPQSIQYVDITVEEPNSGISNTRRVRAKAEYTFP